MSLRVAGISFVALAAAVAVASAAGGPAERAEASGPLGWSAEAILFEHETLKGDWIAAGEIRNGGGEPVRLVATEDVKVVDGDGEPLPSSAVFSKTVGHGLFNPTRLPEAKLPEGELRRIGDVAFVEPGKQVPLTVSWRGASGDPRAVAIEYPGGRFPLPDPR